MVKTLGKEQKSFIHQQRWEDPGIRCFLHRIG